MTRDPWYEADTPRPTGFGKDASSILSNSKSTWNRWSSALTLVAQFGGMASHVDHISSSRQPRPQSWQPACWTCPGSLYKRTFSGTGRLVSGSLQADVQQVQSYLDLAGQMTIVRSLSKKRVLAIPSTNGPLWNPLIDSGCKSHAASARACRAPCTQNARARERSSIKRRNLRPVHASASRAVPIHAGR